MYYNQSTVLDIHGCMTLPCSLNPVRSPRIICTIPFTSSVFASM